MPHDGWHNGWSGGWDWLPMMLMMVLVWGGLIWLAIVLVRNVARHGANDPTGSRSPSGRELLDQRLARGEIDVDEYRSRLDALTSAPRAGRRR
jgi:putative membrane protein